MKRIDQDDETVLANYAGDRGLVELVQPEAAIRPQSMPGEALTGIFQTTLEGRILLANLSVARMLGYETVVELQATVKDVSRDVWTDGEDRQMLLETLAEHGTVLGHECKLQRRDGGPLWALCNARLIFGDEAQPPYIEGYLEDVTSRKQAELELRDSEERYRASFEQAAVGILHTSLQGRILKSNECFARIVGYSPEELAGMEFQAITPVEDRDAGKAAAMRLVNGGAASASFEKRYVRKDGTLTWVMLTISIQRDGAGRPVHFLTMVLDINARKQAEERLAAVQQALRVSEERYRSAFQLSLDSINLNRLGDGMYVDCNKAFLDVTGYTREEVIGHTSIELNIWAELVDRQKMVKMIERSGACRNLEARFRRKSGQAFWGLMSASVIELEGASYILSITRDISDAKSAEDEIRHLEFYDPLTKLPNRRLLIERLRQAVSRSQRSHRQRALLFVDLDNFKTLNDTRGHHIGDLFLEEVAKRLAACIGPGDTAARLGGDEFVVMLEDLGEIAEDAATQAKSVAEKIQACISEPCVLARHECVSTSSIGITVFGGGNESHSRILQQADMAMYHAKAAGRDTIRFFAPALQATVSARAALKDELRQGIRDNQFILWYQPQVHGGCVIGAEALVRWRHPKRGLLAPGEFISLAEETGLIIPLGKFVLEAACRQIALWATRTDAAPITVAVNVSARQFREADFVQSVLAVLRESGADPRKLKLEITESMLLDNLEETIVIMTELKSHGITFSLDDFGTGYSSLAYLKRLPLDQLKIDRAFVRDMLENTSSNAIAQAIVSLSRAMDLSLMAEGVETEEQRACLARLGCNSFQGYLFSPPVPAAEFELLLQNPAANSLRG